MTMNILYGVYILITSGVFLFCFPFFWLYTRISGKYGDGLRERLGYSSPELTLPFSGATRVWIHAASLGEIKVAVSIINSLKSNLPHCLFLLSTTTAHGRDLANNTVDKSIPVIYAPIDFIVCVRKALTTIRPDVLVFLETEIWPVWIREARRMGTKIALINGRISLRSYPYYHRVRSFLRVVLVNIDRFSMITEGDRERIISMGADPSKVSVNGNAKYDLLAELAEPSVEQDVRKVFNLEEANPVFIAGSTRKGEENMIIEAYEKIVKEFPDMVLFIAPRHVERTGEIASILENHSIKYQLRSEIDGETLKRREKVVVVNSFGELFRLYSIGTIIFCGASLVPLGGQNPLEAAVWGKAVLYGPHMEDFLDAKALLDENASGIQVTGPDMLAEKAINLLREPKRLKTYGSRAREAVLKNRNSGERHARVISDLIRRA
jgi:3-deoxy-D-manno-octulosonic-acid transferase